MSLGGLRRLASEREFDGVAPSEVLADFQGCRSRARLPATLGVPRQRSWNPKKWLRSSDPVAPWAEALEVACPHELAAHQDANDRRLEEAAITEAPTARRRSWAIGGAFRRKAGLAGRLDGQALALQRSWCDAATPARSASPRRGRGREAQEMSRLLEGLIQEHVWGLLHDQSEAEDADDQLCIALEPAAGPKIEFTVVPASPGKRRTLPPVPENGALAWCDAAIALSLEDCTLESHRILASLAPQVLEPVGPRCTASAPAGAGRAASTAPHGRPRAAAGSPRRRGVVSPWPAAAAR
ncbi:unnamed protein product [Prorocentrum cordatum]|uniref:Uncharacterized protein n=1 Tax=Prorocentrum cordatum TaxID=2364126 RepID=A0ABN9PIU4_9DINO|nr:unnamed protein product [Polarella glacialis]